MTATGVAEPDEALTDPEEMPWLELESSLDDEDAEDDELEVSELELEVLAAAEAADAVVFVEALPGIVWALT